MIKIEAELLEDRGVAAFSVIASGVDDLKTLDLFHEALSGGYELEMGYASSNRLVLHVRGMPREYFEKSKEAEKTP